MSSHLAFTASVAFFSTTLDDIVAFVFLIISKIDDPDVDNPFAKIMIGQLIGFTVIISISLIGLILGAVIPVDYIDLIGFVPVCLGVYELYSISVAKPSDQPDTMLEKEMLVSRAEGTPIVSDRQVWRASATFDADDLTDRETSSNQSDINYKTAAARWKGTIHEFLKQIVDPLILESILFALVCGLDNITIYTSLFIASTPDEVLFTISVFYALLVVNGMLSLWIIKNHSFVVIFQKYSKYVISILLIVLGLDILSDSIIRHI